ncbi:MAG: SDR family oxidoreductase [Acidobacteriota bacterium]
MRFSGKRVVVTGGSSGIGFAVAKAVIEFGGRVIIAARNEEKLKRAARKLGENAISYSLDVTQECEVKAFFGSLEKFDHLVTCAAGMAIGPFLEMDVAPVREYFETKFWGQFYAAKHGAKKLNAGGSVILFAGVASRKGSPGLTASAAINGAVEGLAKTLAVELMSLRIRVNVLSPGLIDTEAFDPMPAEQKQGLFQSVAEKLPVQRVGKPEDVAKAVMYLMENEYVTGSTAVVDGGYCAT